MAGITIQWKGIRGLRNRLDAIEDLGPFMRDLALVAVEEQKRRSPVKTGNLRRSINVGRITARSAETIARANYAAYVELGTQPHEIRPRVRRALRWKVQGGYRFATRVQHPGTRAQPFMVPGARAAIQSARIAERIYDLWNRAD